jgi:hypothetical protein
MRSSTLVPREEVATPVAVVAIMDLMARKEGAMSLLAAACVDYAHLLRRKERPRCSFGAALGSRWIRSNVSGSLAVGVLRCLPCCRGYLAQPLPP